MADLFQQQSPLVQIEFGEPEGGAPRIEEKPFLGYLVLRGRSEHTGFIAATLKVLGVEAPVEANRVIAAGEHKMFWLGPDEWLLLTPPGRLEALLERLRDALGDAFYALTEQSAGHTVIRVDGPRARDTLAKGCLLYTSPSPRDS